MPSLLELSLDFTHQHEHIIGCNNLIYQIKIAPNPMRDADTEVPATCYSLCSRSNLSSVRKTGADANVRSGRLGAALIAACYKGRLLAVRKLLAMGADVNMKVKKYGNAFSVVTEKGQKEIAQLLIGWGAWPMRSQGQHSMKRKVLFVEQAEWGKEKTVMRGALGFKIGSRN